MLVLHRCIYVSADGASTDALLIRDGRIVAIGEQALALSEQSDEVFRPEGACVFPALCDAHIHLWGLGLRRGSISLAAATSTADVYESLRGYDLDAAPGGWVLGRDWDQHRWTGETTLDIERLDSLCGGHPLVLRRIDGHALWVNSVALSRAGIAPDWDPGPNGHVGRTSSGRPNGLLVDDAMDPVLAAIPPPSEAEDLEVFRESCRILRGHGCAGAHVAWTPLDRVPMLERLRATGELPLRLHLLLDGRDEGLAEVVAAGPVFDEWMNVAGVKFFADGALGSQGAHLLDGYSDGTHGLVLESPEHLTERSRELSAAGWQVAVHAIGDAAASSVLDAFSAMEPGARLATRPRIEHCQMLTDRDVARFSELDVIASIQAIHMYSDATWAVDELSAAQLDRLFRWADLQRQAPCVAGGSDYPIEDPNPWHGIATSVLRQDRIGRSFRPEQSLDVVQALRSYTEGAAWASFREHHSGQLTPGYLADFAVLATDPFAASPQELWDMQVLSTHIAD